jgi:hypothetical protein
MKYIVFQDGPSGFYGMEELSSDTLIGATENIERASQNYMYYVYKTHSENVPFCGRVRATYYKFVQTVRGKTVSPSMERHKDGLSYAINVEALEFWLFTDFGEI